MVVHVAPFTRNAVLIVLVCGLVCVTAPGSASAQSLQDRVEQRMEAGEAALDSAASAVEEPAAESAPVDEPAAAQETPASMPMEEATAPVEEAPAEPSPEPSDIAQGEAAPPPTTYTVQPGDSLWSISSEFLTDPFFWPRLWDVNPSVTNPDLIFPGNVLALPGRQPAELAEAAPPADEAPMEMAEEEAPMEEPPMMEPPVEPEAEEPMVAEEEVLPGEQAPSFEVLPPPPTQSKEILAVSSGYIAKELPVAGRVVGTPEYRILLGELDRIYLLAKGGALEPDGRYTVYRRIKRVIHPVSRRRVGDLIQILGEVQVQQVNSVSTAIVLKSYTAIEPGDPIMPTRAMEAVPMPTVVERSPEPMIGVVLEVLDQRHLNGQFDIVYIDVGEAAGVMAGDRFRIFRRGEKAPGYAPIANVRLPDRQVGELEVLSVRAETATALLITSAEVVQPGDRIER
ncbi:MAG: LysM peptidoglycan-binding domain-containing protein [Nitrospirota bacterium]